MSDRAGEDDVWETTMVLAWNDPDFNMQVNARDELTAGLVMVHRGQAHTSSEIYIGDIFFRLRWSAFGRRAPQIYSEGELYTIQGRTNGVALTGDFCGDADDETAAGCTEADGSVTPLGRTATPIGANIWGGALRIGVDDPLWAVTFESGFSTGQAGSPIGATTLTQRPNNMNYQVGLLLFPVVLNVRTANSYAASALWSNGGVWNSIYMLPQVRFRPLGHTGGVELIGQFMVAWADQLNDVLRNQRADGSTSCSLSDDCFLGWELDLALKLSWGPNDEMRWSNEFAIAGVGPALGAGGDPLDFSTGNRLTEEIMWTLQTRIAFVF